MAIATFRYVQYDSIAREVGRRAAVDITQETVRATALDAQVGVPLRTGGLSASQFHRTQRTPDSATGMVGYRADHAMAVHDGARPHKIRPRNPRGALRFRYKGRVIVTSEVNHPGYRGNPWLYNALKRQSRFRGFRVVRF